MKVYIIEVISAEPYENHSWIKKVFDSEEKAIEYANKNESEEFIYTITVRDLE